MTTAPLGLASSANARLDLSEHDASGRAGLGIGLPPTVAPPGPTPGTPHMRGMGANGGHLYTVEVRPSRHDPGRFTWAIRDRGKLVRGSYRPHASEGAARAVALAEVERLIGHDEPQNVG